jgi:hypothetical protein
MSANTDTTTPAPVDYTKKAALSIRDFCDAHDLSRTLFDKLVREGRGPELMHVDGIVRISAEAAARWRRQMEKAPVTHKRGIARRAKAEATEAPGA